MTLWLDEITVRQYFVSPLDTTARTEVSHTGARTTISVIYNTQAVTFSTFDLSSVHEYLNALGDCNPELTFTTENRYPTLQLTADEDAYRDE